MQQAKPKRKRRRKDNGPHNWNPDPGPEELAQRCLEVRMTWTFDHRVGAIENVELCRQQPDWQAAWDTEIVEHRQEMDSDED